MSARIQKLRADMYAARAKAYRAYHRAREANEYRYEQEHVANRLKREIRELGGKVRE